MCAITAGFISNGAEKRYVQTFAWLLLPKKDVALLSSLENFGKSSSSSKASGKAGVAVQQHEAGEYLGVNLQLFAISQKNHQEQRLRRKLSTCKTLFINISKGFQLPFQSAPESWMLLIQELDFLSLRRFTHLLLFLKNSSIFRAKMLQ